MEITPIVCDLTNAPDTGPERLREYQRLFAQALIGRERTADGIRFRLRADEGVEAWVRDLAAREKACCAFFDFRVRVEAGQVHWDATVVDDDIARAVLDEFYDLPDTLGEGVEGIEHRLTGRGLRVLSDPAAPVILVRRDGAEEAGSRS
jgi:hypothetical protein